MDPGDHSGEPRGADTNLQDQRAPPHNEGAAYPPVLTTRSHGGGSAGQGWRRGSRIRTSPGVDPEPTKRQRRQALFLTSASASASVLKMERCFEIRMMSKIFVMNGRIWLR